MHLHKLKLLRRNSSRDKTKQMSPFRGYVFVDRESGKRFRHGACGLVFMKKASSATTELALQSVKQLMRRFRALPSIVIKGRKRARDLSPG